MSKPRKPRPRCLLCGNEAKRIGYKYCSNECQITYQYKKYIDEWKAGKVDGIQHGLGVVSRHVKRYLREKYENKCCICGWSEINRYTEKVPVVADHIDGDWRNNVEANLRLLCPNCDALTSTFAGLNRGNGRKDRRVSNRVMYARSERDKPM